MLSLIILSYNDGLSLREILPSWINVLEQLTGTNYEVIIADDAGNDDTEAVIHSFSVLNENIHYVRSAHNQGVGGNFRMGIQHAIGEYIAYTDGDGQYVADDLKILWEKKEKYDLLSGNRIHRADPVFRSMVSGIYNLLVKMIYRVNVRDINSGLKLFHRECLEKCLPQVSNGPFYDAEYLIKSYNNGFRIKEFAIGHNPRKYGKAGGISRRSLRLLFSELCNPEMKGFVRNNYFSTLLFKALSICSSRPVSSSKTLMLPNDSVNLPFNT